MMSNDEFLRQLYYFKAFGYSFVSDKAISKRDVGLNFDELNSQIKNCNLCELCKSRNKAICGAGNKNSKVVFVLQAPNPSDDESGVLLSDSVGEKFYEYVFQATNLKKDEFFITSLIKCKPTSWVDLRSCFEFCRSYFEAEISQICPKIIVTLGEDTFAKVIKNENFGNFASIRSNVIRFHNSLLMPTFSPFWIAKNPSKIDLFLQDLSKIRRYL